jgi:hypothetical protein
VLARPRGEVRRRRCRLFRDSPSWRAGAGGDRFPPLSGNFQQLRPHSIQDWGGELLNQRVDRWPLHLLVSVLVGLSWAIVSGLVVAMFGFVHGRRGGLRSGRMRLTNSTAEAPKRHHGDACQQGRQDRSTHEPPTPAENPAGPVARYVDNSRLSGGA